MFDISSFRQALPETGKLRRRFVGRSAADKPDYGHRCLLRARRERPRGRTAEQRDEIAPLHLRGYSITSSARASSVGGTVRPSAFAALRLMTSSNLVGCSIGRSAGLAPLKILSM